jgi:hypothetical protein
MAKKPEFKVVRKSGDGSERVTVGRHVTQSAATQARHRKRADLERGSSDWFTVERIHHRNGEQ